MRKLPRVLRFINWPIVASFWFFVAALLWTICPLWCWISNEEDEECDYVCFAGAICFVINGVCSVIDWWDMRSTSPYMIYGGGGVTKPWIEKIDWFLISNISFFFGAFGDVCTTTIDSWILKDNKELGATFAGYSDIFATHLWVVSGLSQMMVWYLNSAARKLHDSPIQYSMRPCYAPSSPAKHLNKERVLLFDWNGWGDWLFLPGGLLYALGSYRCFWYPIFHECWAIQTAAGLAYLINSISYMPSIYLKYKYPRYYDLDHANVLASMSLLKTPA